MVAYAYAYHTHAHTHTHTHTHTHAHTHRHAVKHLFCNDPCRTSNKNKKERESYPISVLFVVRGTATAYGVVLYCFIHQKAWKTLRTF
jgi:hypothetical protein